MPFQACGTEESRTPALGLSSLLQKGGQTRAKLLEPMWPNLKPDKRVRLENGPGDLLWGREGAP